MRTSFDKNKLKKEIVSKGKDVCNYRDCKIKENLKKCPYCDYYFCEEHYSPKMALSLQQVSTAKEPFQTWLRKEWDRQDGHPDFTYTQIAWEYLKNKEKEAAEKIWQALEDMKNAGKRQPTFPIIIVEPKPKPITEPKAKPSHEPVTEPILPRKDYKKLGFAGFIILIIIGIILLMPKTMSKEIPYVLNNPEKIVYLSSECRGKIDESLIGTPIKEKLNEGWKIEYQDIPALSITSQKITVEMTTTLWNQLSENSGSWSRIFSLQSFNCTDGTFYGQCSGNQPYYCFNGTLVKNSTACGCPYDFKVNGNDCEKIQRCNDRTIYEECSTSKPFYCLNGSLVEKASLCGCSGDDIPQGDSCVSKFLVEPKDIQLNYIDGSISFTVYKGMSNYLASLPRDIWYNQGETPPTTKDFIMRKLDNSEQKKMLDRLVDNIKGITTDRDSQARIAIRMIQKIPYDWNAFTSSSVSGKYPYEVLYTYTGVCSEKAELLAYLLRGLGYGISLFEFTTENHEAVGIKCPTQYSFRNTGYCFVESAQPSIITDDQENYVGVGKLVSTPSVIFISDGISFDSVSQEYNDAQQWLNIQKLSSANGNILDSYNYNLWLSLVNKYGIEVASK